MKQFEVPYIYNEYLIDSLSFHHLQLMKQQRVKLMNQIKDDAEQFRKLKQELAKEVLQLKSVVSKAVSDSIRIELFSFTYLSPCFPV